MPKLTRTQKYADVREQIKNDGETAFNTRELENLRKKLDNLEEQAAPKNENNVVQAKDIVDETLNVNINDNKTIIEMSDAELINKAQKIADLPNEIIKPTKIDTSSIFITLPNNEEEIKNDIVKPKEIIEEKSNIIENPAIDEAININSSLKEIHDKTIENINEITKDILTKQENPTIDIKKETDILSEESLNAKADELVFDNKEDIKTNVLEDYQSANDISDNYISDTIKEVNNYNRKEGEKLIDDIPISIIDEVRNHVSNREDNNEIINEETIDTIEYINDEKKETISNIQENIHNEDIHSVIDESINNIDTSRDTKDDSLIEKIIEDVTTNNNVLNDNNEETMDDVATFINDQNIEEDKNDYPEIKNINDEVVLDNIDYYKDIDEDEEFSTTVSLQISKIMDELENKNEQDTIPEALKDVKKVSHLDVDASDYDRSNVPDFISAYFDDYQKEDNEKDDEYFEHPVKALTFEDHLNDQTEVVEIKNISELDDNIISNTAEETKPFVKPDEIEETNPSTPNRILNIILTVLIIILIGVLIVIVYYILVARGVI